MATGPDNQDGDWSVPDSSDELAPVLRPFEGNEEDDPVDGGNNEVRFGVSEVLNLNKRAYPFGSTPEESKQCVIDSIEDQSPLNQFVKDYSKIGHYLEGSVTLGLSRIVGTIYPVEARLLFDASSFLKEVWKHKAMMNTPYPYMSIRDAFCDLSLSNLLGRDDKYGRFSSILQLPPVETGGRFPHLAEVRRLTFWDKEPLTSSDVHFMTSMIRDAFSENNSITAVIRDLFNCSFGNLGGDFNLPIDEFFPQIVKGEKTSLVLSAILVHFLELLSSCVDVLEKQAMEYDEHSVTHQMITKRIEFFSYLHKFFKYTRQEKWSMKSIDDISAFEIMKDAAQSLPRSEIEEEMALTENDKYWSYFLNNMSVGLGQITQNISSRLNGWMNLQRSLRNRVLIEYLEHKGHQPEIDHVDQSNDASKPLKLYLWSHCLTLLVDNFVGGVDVYKYRDLPRKNT